MTAETLHTPGPWAVSPFRAWVICDRFGKDGDFLPVAAMLWPTDERTEDETYADARLIAAAPELLASVIELLEPLERASAAMVEQGMALNEHGEAAFDRARAAIAKATGATTHDR